MPVTMQSKLSEVAGRNAKKIEKAFDYATVGELLHHYPRRYAEKGDLLGLSALVPDEQVTVLARVLSTQLRPYRDKRSGRMMDRVEAVIGDGTNELVVTFFDSKGRSQGWRAKKLQPGMYGLFAGKVGRFRDRWQLTNPHVQMFVDEHYQGSYEQAVASWEARPGLVTIYPATSTLHTWHVEAAIHFALDVVDRVPEPLPKQVRARWGLLDARTALEQIHRPHSWMHKNTAEWTLAFQEAFVAQVVLAQRRRELMQVPAEPRTGRAGGLLDRFDERLPFALTGGQQEVGGQILDDLAAGHPMHRLLQGEVGSGKTVVALRAMLRVVDSGGQAVLLAPTEVLAQQHHRSITALLGDLAAGGMLGGADDGTRVALLTGSLGAAARREALLDAASGAAGIVIGTHALLEDKVQFADLGLVVVDEQHRFGVEQRAALSAKAGESRPHVLVMTATPIPRTVAMTVFGDLETSTLAELPAGRAPIQTSVVPMLARPGWLDRAWARVREEVGRGHQAYVVCPRIGDDPATAAARNARWDDEEEPLPDEEPEEVLAGVEEIAPMLAAGPLEGLRVEVLHGRLAPDRKDKVMRAFAAGDIDVLVSTTVIEVGVDVGNATVMVVLDADRFGVSQLHQLRGRVGRGGHPGLCLLVTKAEDRSPARERLDAVAGTLDGFELSRVDLEQRREGNLLGASQSGRSRAFKVLSVLRHEDVIAQARESATAFVEEDPDLSTEPDLAAAVLLLEENEQADYLEKA